MTFHLSIRPRSRPLCNADSRVVDGFRMDGIVSKRTYIYTYVYMFACMNLDNLLTRGGCNFLKKILLFLIFFFFCCVVFVVFRQ